MPDIDDRGAAPSGEAPGESKRKSSKLWTPYGEPGPGGGGAKSEAAEPGTGQPSQGAAEAGSEDSEELRRRMEEALEKLSIAQYLVEMSVELSSLAYMKMGIPKDVNAKFKDMEQAKLAIDAVDAIVGVLAAVIPDEALRALTGTLDNMKLNFAKES